MAGIRDGIKNLMSYELSLAMRGILVSYVPGRKASFVNLRVLSGS
jgi:hypothetical protein